MMEPQNNTEQTNRDTPSASLGTILREARERTGFRIEDVAAQIKFAPRQIEALEADDYKHLPEPAFLRGFVRSYAKILNLDAQPLLAALPQEKTAPPELIPASVNVPYPVDNTAQRQNLILLGSALLLAVIAVAFSVWHFTTPLRQSAGTKIETPVTLPAQNQVKPETPVEKHDMAAPSSLAEIKRQSSSEVESRQQSTSITETKRQTPANAAQSSVRVPKTKAVSTAAESSVQAAKTTAVQATPKSQADESGNPGDTEEPAIMLRLVFEEESWTEITDKDGKMISSQINPRGSELNVRGHLPLSLVIGHAATTRLYKDGAPVDLTPYINSSSEVARITLE